MRRVQAIKDIMSTIKDEVVITSCGMISREAYQVKDRKRNFYVMGAMGSELGIGIGLAHTRPDLKVMVISGDGSALMGLSAMLLDMYLHLENLQHFVLDNRCYASTGGQKTCPVVFACWSAKIIDVSAEKGKAPRIPLKPAEITRRFRNAISLNST